MFVPMETLEIKWDEMCCGSFKFALAITAKSEESFSAPK